jgi:hypothetical protein
MSYKFYFHFGYIYELLVLHKQKHQYKYNKMRSQEGHMEGWTVKRLV